MVFFISSSLIYAFFGAFGFPANGTSWDSLIWVFEGIFLADMVLQFLLEYQPDDSFGKVRDLYLIAKRYVQGQFLIDLLAILPLQFLTT